MTKLRWSKTRDCWNIFRHLLHHRYQICFNVILLSTSCYSKWFLSFMFPIKLLYAFLISSMRHPISYIYILFEWVPFPNKFHFLNTAYRRNMTCRCCMGCRLNVDSFEVFKSNVMEAKLVSSFHISCKFIVLSSIPFSDILFYEVQTKPALFIDVCYKQGWRGENVWRNNSESCRNHGQVSNPDTNWIHRLVFRHLTFRNIRDPSCYSSVNTSINF
jgi:hypothetical protein